MESGRRARGGASARASRRRRCGLDSCTGHGRIEDRQWSQRGGETPRNGVFLLPVTAFAAGFAAWRQRPLVAFALLGGFGLLDLLVVGGGWLLWARERPDVIAAGLSLARMRLGAHWPTDVIGGALIAAAWLAVNVLALRRAES